MNVDAQTVIEQYRELLSAVQHENILLRTHIAELQARLTQREAQPDEE